MNWTRAGQGGILGSTLRQSFGGAARVSRSAQAPIELEPTFSARGLLGAPTTPAFLRLPAIRLLADIGNAAALDVLLRVVDAGSSLMGKRKLAPKSPEVLAALTALRAYRGDRRAAELLSAAEASRDDELRLAATVGT